MTYFSINTEPGALKPPCTVAASGLLILRCSELICCYLLYVLHLPVIPDHCGLGAASAAPAFSQTYWCTVCALRVLQCSNPPPTKKLLHRPFVGSCRCFVIIFSQWNRKTLTYQWLDMLHYLYFSRGNRDFIPKSLSSLTFLLQIFLFFVM